ncbi:MAG: alpha/beta hydrolase [Rikenellaceae bacterium]
MEYKYRSMRVNIEIQGEGDDIILLHGWECDNTIFDRYKPLLASKYRLHTFDLSGFGGSDEPDSVWGTSDYAEMVRSYVVDMGIGTPSLIGHSFGGRISILYGARHSVKRMILTGSAGIVPHRPLSYYYKVYTFKAVRNVCELLLPRKMAKKVIDKYRGGSGSADYNNASPRMRQILSKVVNEDLKPFMPKISAPTLLFWGDRDTATPLSDGKTMERLIPDAGLVVAQGGSHFAFLEAPALFESVVRSFFDIK